MAIQAQLHFCWIGGNLPWAYVFAILSAVERSQLSFILLHHTEPLKDNDALRALKSCCQIRLCHIDAPGHLARTGKELGLGDELSNFYRRLQTPVMRADLLRASLLYAYGGIYLDLDTITVASLLPLLDEAAFIGSEFIVWPASVRRSRSPAVWARHFTLDLLRKACRHVPYGWRAFRHIERFYPRSLNNAVIGAECQSPFIADYLRAMIEIAPERLANRYALGPHLLQDLAARVPNPPKIHRPSVFYPLPPEVSEHWFRYARRIGLADILSTDTRVVHWYASVRTRQLVTQITPGYVVRNRHRQPYSALVYATVGQSSAFKTAALGERSKPS